MKTVLLHIVSLLGIFVCCTLLPAQNVQHTIYSIGNDENLLRVERLYPIKDGYIAIMNRKMITQSTSYQCIVKLNFNYEIIWKSFFRDSVHVTQSQPIGISGDTLIIAGRMDDNYLEGNPFFGAFGRPYILRLNNNTGAVYEMHYTDINEAHAGEHTILWESQAKAFPPNVNEKNLSLFVYRTPNAYVHYITPAGQILDTVSRFTIPTVGDQRTMFRHNNGFLVTTNLAHYSHFYTVSYYNNLLENKWSKEISLPLLHDMASNPVYAFEVNGKVLIPYAAHKYGESQQDIPIRNFLFVDILSQNGDFIERKEYAIGDMLRFSIGSASLLPEGNIIVSVTTKAIEPVENQRDGANMYIVEIDASGNLLWEYVLGEQEGVLDISDIQYANGKILAAGSSTNNSPIIVELQKPVSVGEQNSSKNGITVYPVPAQNTIRVVSATSIGEFSITNIVGMEVGKGFENDTMLQIDVSTFPSGIYFIHTKSGESMQISRFMITK